MLTGQSGSCSTEVDCLVQPFASSGSRPLEQNCTQLAFGVSCWSAARTTSIGPQTAPLWVDASVQLHLLFSHRTKSRFNRKSYRSNNDTQHCMIKSFYTTFTKRHFILHVETVVIILCNYVKILKNHLFITLNLLILQSFALLTRYNITIISCETRYSGFVMFNDQRQNATKWNFRQFNKRPSFFCFIQKIGTIHFFCTTNTTNTNTDLIACAADPFHHFPDIQKTNEFWWATNFTYFWSAGNLLFRFFVFIFLFSFGLNHIVCILYCFFHLDDTDLEPLGSVWRRNLRRCTQNNQKVHWSSIFVNSLSGIAGC